MTLAKKYLVIGPSWVGDMVMSQPLFKLLKEKNPENIIHVAVPNWGLPILRRMPEVSHIIPVPINHGELKLKLRYQIGKDLRQQQYDEAIVFPVSYKSAFIPVFAKIPKRTGFLGEMRYGLLNNILPLDKNRLPLFVQRMMSLALPKNAVIPDFKNYYPQLIVDQVQQQKLREKFQLDDHKPILAICPGAEFGSSKRWPVEHFAHVAKHQVEQGWQVLLLGSPKDASFAEQIQQLSGGCCIDTTGKTDLLDAIDLIACAAAVVTNDSGLMSVASAVNVPVIAIYGSSTPTFTPPLTEKGRSLLLDLPCSPCRQRECPLQHKRCLQDLLPQKVISELAQLG